MSEGSTDPQVERRKAHARETRGRYGAADHPIDAESVVS